MRQRPMMTLLAIMFLAIAVGMAACSGVRSGTAASFTAAIGGHQAGMAAVGEGHGPAAKPYQPLTPDSALEERLPEGVRLAAGNAVAAVCNAYLQRRRIAIQEKVSQSPSALPGEVSHQADGASDAK
jgi:hypothetical protein